MDTLRLKPIQRAGEPLRRVLRPSAPTKKMVRRSDDLKRLPNRLEGWKQRWATPVSAGRWGLPEVEG